MVSYLYNWTQAVGRAGRGSANKVLVCKQIVVAAHDHVQDTFLEISDGIKHNTHAHTHTCHNRLSVRGQRRRIRDSSEIGIIASANR